MLYYRGPGAPPSSDRNRIRATRGLRVIDEEFPALLLVECTEIELRKTLRELNGWTIEPEYPVQIRRD